MRAEALDVIDQVVARGDGGKKPVDLRGALFAWTVEFVSHVGQRRPNTEQAAVWMRLKTHSYSREAGDFCKVNEIEASGLNAAKF